MRGRQVRAVTRESRAPLRLLAQVRRIDPDPGIRFSGTRDHRLARRHFGFESRKSCGWARGLARIWNSLPVFRRVFPTADRIPCHVPAYSAVLSRARGYLNRTKVPAQPAAAKY